MLNISHVNNIYNTNTKNNMCVNKHVSTSLDAVSAPALEKVSPETLQAYHPSFSGLLGKNGEISNRRSLSFISKQLDKETAAKLKELKKSGILDDTSSNDGSSVLENLYKIAKEPRIQGLDNTVILTETINALYNPESITQKFGDLPDEVIAPIEQDTGEAVPEEAKHVLSNCCVAASIEYKLASKKPAEFARFAAGLSSENYSVAKKIKLSDIDQSISTSIRNLREFNTDSNVSSWDDVEINITPDRNAIIRARVQQSYRDKGERSSVDVLMQSALLNLGSQASYNSITDERAGTLNPDRYGLNDYEKNFVENVVFEKPAVSLVYQNINADGKLDGYNCPLETTKQHILDSLNLGESVIAGCTYLDDNKQVVGGHEITIVGYTKDENGAEYFICNDTDDEIDQKVQISADELIPLIHHAGIPKEVLGEDVSIDPWRDLLDNLQEQFKENNNSYNSAA